MLLDFLDYVFIIVVNNVVFHVLAVVAEDFAIGWLEKEFWEDFLEIIFMNKILF